MLSANHKTIAAPVFLLLIIGALALFGTNSVAQKKIIVLDNIVVTKKIVYSNSDRAIDFISETQKFCTKLKEESYASTKLPLLAPRTEDYTKTDEIKKFQNATVTEYFRGTSYAKYEVGQEWLPSESQAKKQNPDEFDCSLKVNKFFKGEIRTPTQKLSFSKYNDEQGKVEVSSLSVGLFERIQIPKLPQNLEPIKVNNIDVECLTNRESVNCYFKNIPVHLATKKLVILQTKLLDRGVNALNDSLFYSDLGLFKQASKPDVHVRDLHKSDKFDSISIGKEIPDSKFDMSMFKDFKIIYKN